MHAIHSKDPPPKHPHPQTKEIEIDGNVRL